MRCRALFSASAALALAAPAPAVAQNVPQVPTVRATDGDQLIRGMRDRVLLDSIAVWNEVPASPAQVYTRVRQILDSLKLPYTQADSTGGLIANPSVVVRRLGGVANSKSLRCGFGPSGDYADTWRVTASYAVYVHQSTRAGGGTRLGVAVMGQARDMSGASSSSVYCASTGKLESDITSLVQRDPGSAP